MVGGGGSPRKSRPRVSFHHAQRTIVVEARLPRNVLLPHAVLDSRRFEGNEPRKVPDPFFYQSISTTKSFHCFQRFYSFQGFYSFQLAIVRSDPGDFNRAITVDKFLSKGPSWWYRKLKFGSIDWKQYLNFETMESVGAVINGLIYSHRQFNLNTLMNLFNRWLLSSFRNCNICQASPPPVFSHERFKN